MKQAGMHQQSNGHGGGIVVVNFGGQYAHLIAKRIRHLGVFAEVVSPQSSATVLEDRRGVILSGGPSSILRADALKVNPAFLNTELPILGLCYGHQLLTQHYGGSIKRMEGGEYGKTSLELLEASHPLFAGLEEMMTAEKDGGDDSKKQLEVWMSHRDMVCMVPPGFRMLARTGENAVAVMADSSRRRFGMQFHPEVRDTVGGERMLENFVRLTGARRCWSMEGLLERLLVQCREQVQGRKVLMLLSGGVDSTVAFAVLKRALEANQLRGLFVDNGFLRLHEARQVRESYQAMGWENIQFVDASEEFLQALAGLSDPQKKRIAVGEKFLRVRDAHLRKMGMDDQDWLLGQGTLYPDIIESGGAEHAETIKWHHNRVDAVTEMIAAGRVVEPLAELYKDEVRQLGEILELPPSLVWRHPFPGPGLSINVLCSDDGRPPAGVVKAKAGLCALGELDPYRAEVLDVCSVGVQGDVRTYSPAVALVGPADWDLLEHWATEITNGVQQVNRVVYLLCSQQLPTLSLHQGYCDKSRLDLLRKADNLVATAFKEAGWMKKIFQLLVILLPLGETEQSESLVLRPVVSEDVMTARFAQPPWRLLQLLTQQLMELPQIDAVFYDVTHKPPATFGWE